MRARMLLGMVGLSVAGCGTPKLDANEAIELLVKPTRGLLGGYDVGDSWDEIQAKHDARYTVRDDTSRQLRRDFSDPGENGFFLDFGVDPVTKKVRRVDAEVYGDRPNAPAVALVEQAFSAKFDAQYGKGTCAASPDPRAAAIECTWGPDKNTPLAKTHSFVLKEYGTAHLSVSVAAAK